MTLYGYARVSVREPEDKNLDLQVERLVRAGCSLGNIRAEEASGAKNDRGGLLEPLDLVVEGDALMVTHIDRLSRGLTYGLQVIEGLHRAGVEFRSLSEDFDTATATGKLQLAMVLAFSDEFGTLRRLLESRMGRRGKREYVQVLRLLETFSQQEVHATVKDAIHLGSLSFDAVKHLVLCRLEGRPPRLDMELYPYLTRVRVSTTSTQDYMALLTGRAA